MVWFGDLVCMLLAVIGYTAVSRGLGDLTIPATQPTLHRTRPWALALLSLATALVLQAFIPGISESREIFLVLQLFILTQFVFNAHLQPWEHGLRWLILLGFWLAARPEM